MASHGVNAKPSNWLAAAADRTKKKHHTERAEQSRSRMYVECRLSVRRVFLYVCMYTAWP